MVGSYMHLWQSFSLCPINWFIQSVAQYADNANFTTDEYEMKFYLYNWYNLEAINFFFTNIIQLYLPKSHIFVP